MYSDNRGEKYIYTNLSPCGIHILYNVYWQYYNVLFICKRLFAHFAHSSSIIVFACLCDVTFLTHKKHSVYCTFSISIYEFHRNTTKQGGHSSLLRLIDMHSKHCGSKRRRDLPGNVMVSARSTLPLLNNSLWFGESSFLSDTIGDLAKLAGEIHTNGAGMPLPEGLNWMGRPTFCPPNDLGSSFCMCPLDLLQKSECIIYNIHINPCRKYLPLLCKK